MNSGKEPTSRGPFLTAAAFFEVVIREDTGVLSLVRMIDRITISAHHDSINSLPPSSIRTNLVVSFRGQNLERSGTISIHPEKPSGDRMDRMEIPFVLDAQSGLNLNIALDLLVDEAGYYWFDILMDDEVVTQTPLQIVFQSAAESMNGDSAENHGSSSSPPNQP